MDRYTPAQRKLYMKNYRAERMRKAHAILGGSCSRCGKTDKLEFDHIDPSTKIKAVTKLLQASNNKFYTEVAKCQLLCKKCHIEKTKEDLPEKQHGLVTTYWSGCRCYSCKCSSVIYSKVHRKG